MLFVVLCANESLSDKRKERIPFCWLMEKQSGFIADNLPTLCVYQVSCFVIVSLIKESLQILINEVKI